MFGPLSSRSAVAITPSPPRAGRRRACRPGGPLSRPDASVAAEASAADPYALAAYARRMTMVSGNTLAEVAGLIGDPARANMLSALMDRRALTAGELAWAAGVSAPTASGHLARLAEARLV